MSEQGETTNPDPQSEPGLVGQTPNDVQPETDEGVKADQEQGVGVAPTEPGDAGEGNPGTHPESTDEIEAKLGRQGEEGTAE